MKALFSGALIAVLLTGCGHETQSINQTDCKEVARLATDALLNDSQVIESSHEGIIAAGYQKDIAEGRAKIAGPPNYSAYYGDYYRFCLKGFHEKETG